MTTAIPTAPWKTGDEPVKGQVHVDIFTSGRQYTDEATFQVEVADGTKKDIPFDLQFELDRRPYDLPDPAKEFGDSLRGFTFGKNQDANCGGTRWMLAHTEKFWKPVRRILQAISSQVIRMINEAAQRPNATIPGRPHAGSSEVTDQSIRHVMIRISCHSGRHRAPGAANELARMLRKAGCTVRIHHMHLYRGIHDRMRLSS